MIDYYYAEWDEDDELYYIVSEPDRKTHASYSMGAVAEGDARERNLAMAKRLRKDIIWTLNQISIAINSVDSDPVRDLEFLRSTRDYLDRFEEET